MASVVTFDLDGKKLPVLLEEKEARAVELQRDRGAKALKNASARIDEALGGVGALLGKMITSIVEVDLPSQVETTLTISLKFSASAGIVVAGASTEGAISLSVKVNHGGDAG